MSRRSLKSRFALTVAIVYLLLGALSFVAFQMATGRIVRSLGTSFAIKEALLEKSRLMSAIQRDLSLSLKMADSPLLQQWALDEENAALKKLALNELENYRTHYKGKSLFFALDRSRHYYFSDGASSATLAAPRYTLNPDNANDAWYFRTLHGADAFELNVDYDSHLHLTKVWFNVVIRDGAGKGIGLGGSGIDITQFINEIVNSDEPGVETILLARDGAIEGHRDKQYVLHNSRVRGREAKITVYNLIPDAADRTALQQAIQDLVAGRREAETLNLTVGGKRCLAALAYMKEIQWLNLVLVDASQAVSRRELLPMLAITVLSLFAVIVLIGLLLTRLVLTPLAALAGSARQIARGDFDIAMPVRSDDEIGALTRSFNDMARMVKDHSENLEQKVNDRTEALNLSNRKLAEANRQVMDSIRYAQLIQASILPNAAAMVRHVREFFALYQPRDIVGGDFYYFRECGTCGVLAVADCTGHGVPGAFMTMTAKAVMDHVLGSMSGADPAAVLKELNHQLRTALRNDAPDAPIDNGMDLGLCWLDPAAGRLFFAGARMALLCVCRGDLVTVAGDRQPLGYRRSSVDFNYTTHTITIEPGLMCYLATDGILDQSGGPRGWGYGRKRLGALLAEIAGQPAAAQHAALEAALDEYRGEHPQRDDITVVGFRV